MLKRLLPSRPGSRVLALPLQAFAQGFAIDYTDIWYLPSESGWGVNIVQVDRTSSSRLSSSTDPGNRADLVHRADRLRDANGNFAGTLYSTVGTYLGAPWVPNNLVDHSGGTASFVPTSPYQGTLTYSFTDGPTVIKSIQRQVLTTIAPCRQLRRRHRRRELCELERHLSALLVVTRTPLT